MLTLQNNRAEQVDKDSFAPAGLAERMVEPRSKAATPPVELTVFYDGACPLCRREIALYKCSTDAGRICWIDVNRVQELDVAPGLSKAAATARFHVMRRDGTIASGAEAFVTLWHVLPKFRLLATVRHSRLVMGALEWAYRMFLLIRPFMQRAVNLLEKSGDRR